MAEILASSDPTSVSPAIYRTLLVDYLITCESNKLLDLLRYSSASDASVELQISALDLIYHDTPLAFTVINYPKLLLRIFNEAAVVAMQQLHSHPDFASSHCGTSVKSHVAVRIYQLPAIYSHTKPSIGHLRSHETEQLLQVTGTITRTGNIRLLKISKEYQCAKCHYRFRVCSDPEQNYMLPQPSRCPAKAVGSNKLTCVGTTLREVPNSAECIDYQEIKIQDRMERMDVGYLPKSLHVILERDLVDRFAAGDDVVIVGNLLRQWKYFQPGARCHVDIALHANSIRLLKSAVDRDVIGPDARLEFASYWQHHKHCPYTGRDKILRSVCPKLHGMYYVKLCLLLTLIGGSQRQESLSRRHHSHMLLIGSPGTGKSQLLKFASSLLPRSMLTTGVGTTGAGLTCSAVREGADWALEAGALVLANNGVCCIDEFRSIREHDRAAIHEAMEQQTVSVAKAGIVVKLNTKCSVIAASNPKDAYDINVDITTNTGIAAPLLSRFDLVLVLLDVPNKEWDKNISTYLLKQALCGGNDDTASEWPLPKLRRYIMYVREKLHPVMNPEAKCLLMRYYQMQRQQSDRSAARTTVRLLESLLRLADGHAKLMFKEAVTVEDAVVAISCMDTSAGQESMQGQSTLLTADLPPDAELAYSDLETRVFRQLQYSRVALKLDVEKLQSSQAESQTQRVVDDEHLPSKSARRLETHNEIISLLEGDDESSLTIGDMIERHIAQCKSTTTSNHLTIRNMQREAVADNPTAQVESQDDVTIGELLNRRRTMSSTLIGEMSSNIRHTAPPAEIASDQQYVKEDVAPELSETQDDVTIAALLNRRLSRITPAAPSKVYSRNFPKEDKKECRETPRKINEHQPVCKGFSVHMDSQDDETIGALIEKKLSRLAPTLPNGVRSKKIRIETDTSETDIADDLYLNNEELLLSNCMKESGKQCDNWVQSVSDVLPSTSSNQQMSSSLGSQAVWNNAQNVSETVLNMLDEDW